MILSRQTVSSNRKGVSTMIPYYKLSTITKMTLGFVLAISVLLWCGGCNLITFFLGGGGNPGDVQIIFTGPTGGDRFYNARVVRDFTQNVADGIAHSCRPGDETIMETGDMVRQLRALAQDIDDAIDLFIDTPQGNDRVINAVNAAAKPGRLGWYKMLSCGGSPPEVPRVPGYYETFWDIAS
jgi:hypothetical protein